MNSPLYGLVLFTTVLCVGESTEYTISTIVNPFVECIERQTGAKLTFKDIDIKSEAEADKHGYGLQIDAAEGEVDEENVVVHSQDVLLTYPDQEDVNDGPTQLEVEMEDSVVLTKKETYVQEDKLTTNSKVYRVDKLKDDGRTLRRGSSDISDLVGNKTGPYISTRKYKLEPYTTAFVRTTIVRQNVTYPVTRSIYVFGTFLAKFDKTISSSTWKKCGNTELDEKPKKASNGYYINIAAVTDDTDFLTEDNEIDFTLTDKLHRIEEKVIMKINARVNTEKKKNAYERLCIQE